MSLRTCGFAECSDHAAMSYVWPAAIKMPRCYACVIHWLRVCKIAHAAGLDPSALSPRRFQDHPEEFTV